MQNLKLAYVKTYGCAQNISDSEKIKGILSGMGYGFTDNISVADVIIYNTCAIRENAEDKVFGKIGELKILKQLNPDLIIGICGCMTGQKHICDRIKKSYPYVDFILGTNLIHNIKDIIQTVKNTKNKVFDPSNYDGEIIENIPIVRDDDNCASVPIMNGCNNFCTYCIVPYVRGRERSRKSEEILSEIKGLINDGYKEITLLGQNVNSYGFGLDEEINFSKLLRMVNDLDGDFKIKFLTSHPKDASKELVDAICDCKKVVKHFHLPIQSGSNRILELMNRKYTKEQYIEIVEYIRQKIPNIELTSDIIVGFPTETYQDFLQTLEIVKKVKFNALFTFIYSKREGTKAAQMYDEISYAEKSKWFKQLIDEQAKIKKLKEIK
jgi:tRNA-2-methylthio-N6-dimethylallyladenosine synthase